LEYARAILALLAQLESVTHDPLRNAERAAEAVAANAQADIAVFPELYLGAYDLDALEETARPLECDELALIARAAAAAATAVVVGFAERGSDGRLYNSVACIDRDGTPAGVYRKTQLFARERAVFEPGRELRVISLAGVAVGPLICFDVEFPELARALAVSGAELLVTASANMEPYAVDHELATRARALENHLPHLYVNAVGTTGGFRFVGCSRSVGAGGEVLVETGSESSLLVAPVGARGAGDEAVDYLKHLPRALPVVVG
jgi:predicted amidohydrolase